MHPRNAVLVEMQRDAVGKCTSKAYALQMYSHAFRVRCDLKCILIRSTCNLRCNKNASNEMHLMQPEMHCNEWKETTPKMERNYTYPGGLVYQLVDILDVTKSWSLQDVTLSAVTLSTTSKIVWPTLTFAEICISNRY